VLGDAGGQPVAELGVGVEPVKLMVRASHLKRGPGDLRGTRQRGGGARVEQPGPAPHQRHQEKLGHRVQVERQQRAVTVHPLLVGDNPGRARPPMTAGNRYRELQSIVHHGARADHRRPLVDKPSARGIPLGFHPRQPDPVAVPGYVQRMRPADVGDPGPLGGRPDQSRPPGEPTPSRDRQVNLWASPEYQMTAFGEPDDLARRGTDMRCHRTSLGARAGAGIPGFGDGTAAGARGLLLIARRRASLREAALGWGARDRSRKATGGGPRRSPAPRDSQALR